MKANLILADFAQADGTGKIGALGIGWSTTTTPTPPHAVVVLLKVGWNETNRPHKLELTLLTADGHQAVMTPGLVGPHPLSVEATFEVGRPVDIPEGSDIDHNLAINVGAGLSLEPNTRYEWRLTIDSVHREEWIAPFFVRPVPALAGDTV